MLIHLTKINSNKQCDSYCLSCYVEKYNCLAGFVNYMVNISIAIKSKMMFLLLLLSTLSNISTKYPKLREEPF